MNLNALRLRLVCLIVIDLVLLSQAPVLALTLSSTQAAEEKNSAAAGKVLLEAVELGKQRTQESFAKALSKYEEALRLFRLAGDRDFEGLILNNMAEIFSSLGDRKKALDYFTRALVIFEAAHNPPLEAGVLSNLGAIYDDLGEKDKALDYYHKALPLRRSAGDKLGEAITLSNIGYVYHGLGEPLKALQYYNQALALMRETGKRANEAVILNNISNVYQKLGDVQKALDGLNQALEIERAAGDIDGESTVLNSFGNLYLDKGDTHKALDYYNQSLALTRKVGDRAKEANGIANIALVYDTLGEKQKALENYERALALVRTVNDPTSEAHALSNIGVVYQSLGNGERALENFDQALGLLKKIGDRSGEATALNNVGAVYDALGDPQKAINYYEQSLALVEAMGERRTEAILLDNIGASYETLGDDRRALEYHLRSINIAEAIGDKGTLATALRNVGIVYRARGDTAKSIDYLNRALEQSRAVGNPRMIGSALNNLGEAYLDSGDKKKALYLYNQSLPLWRTADDNTGEAGALYGISRAERDLGNLAQARAQIENALSIVESLRTRIRRQDLRSSYFASVQKYYEFYIDLLMRLHVERPSAKNDARALQTAERARARSLLELLKEARADIRQGVDPSLLERERDLQQLINARAEQQLKLLSGNRALGPADQISKEIESLTTQFEQVEAQIRTSSPRYAALTQPESLNVADIQRRVLDDDTLLLEYSLGDEHSYLWVVSKTELTSYELPKRADIDKAARELYALMTTPNQQADSAEQKRGLRVARAAIDDRRLQGAIIGLSKLVLAPAASQLGKKRLLIVADGALQYVPFAALTANANSAAGYLPLIVDHEIISLPSASTLAVLRQELSGRQPANKTIAVLADPVFDARDERIKKPKAPNKLEAPPSPSPAQRGLSIKVQKAAAETGVAREGLIIPRLPGTRQEAEKILALAPAGERKQAIDFAASKATATGDDLSHYRFVHFATHGFLDSLNPELSGIVLSLVDEQGAPQNGFLRAHEIYNLKLPADLIVLSACQTGLGKEIRGEGLVGLTRGFMYAGAARVVVSLWSVDDEATSELMVRLYSRMLKDRLSPASALRAAQVEMLKQPRWQAPYYWAAFVLQGEWK